MPIPIRIAPTEHATVPVRIDGLGEHYFVFDTGAEGTAVYSRFAEQWALRPSGNSETVIGQSGETAIRLTSLPPLHLGQLTAGSIDAGNLLVIGLRIEGEDAVGVIDTGARKTRINWILARKLGLDPATIAGGDTIHGATNRPLASGRATIDSVLLGQRRIFDAAVLVADLPVFAVFGVDRQPAAILGLDWLFETRMLVDFPRQKVWFIATQASAPWPMSPH